MKPARPKRTRLRKGAVAKHAALTRENLTIAQEAIGYVFKDRALLDMAMTHPSALQPNQGAEHSNQRLEFLGDRVLGLVIAERLYARRPGEREGRLAPRLNHLVNKKACAAAALHKGLDAFLILGTSERQNGGAAKENILGDMCEAVIGAIYLDGGLKPAQRFIETAWAPLFNANTTHIRDPKSLLQEWAQANRFDLPDYIEAGRDGPAHAPTFRVDVRVGGAHKATGEGPSKQEAERVAAATLLAIIEGTDT